MDSDLMRWVKAQADDPNANPRFRELLAALEAAREDAWQPIETAPRAELEDLIASDGQTVFAVQWFDGQWVNSFSDIVHPTHWRPIPAPPSIDQSRGKGVQGEAWQPIETAPQDGTAVIGFWSGSRGAVGIVNGTNYGITAFNPESGEWYDASEADNEEVWWRPDFWRPLPDPPRIVPDAGQGGGE